MSENEKRLRERIAARMRRRDAEEALGDLNALLTEHRDEVERTGREKTNALARLGDAVAMGRQQARDAALEEAKAASVRAIIEWMGGAGIGLRCEEYVEQEMRALKSQPERQYVDAEKVREAIRDLRPGDDLLTGKYAQGVRDALEQVAIVLGVDLDAEGEARPVLCECGHEVGWHWDGKRRGCMKKLPESGNGTCPCKSWSPRGAS